MRPSNIPAQDSSAHMPSTGQDGQPPADADEDLRFRIGTFFVVGVGNQPTLSANDAVIQLIGVEEFSGEKIDLFARAHQEGLNISKAWTEKNVKAIKRSAGIIRVIVGLPVPSFPIQMFFTTGAINVCATMLQSSDASNGDVQIVALNLLGAIFRRGCTVAQSSVVLPVLFNFIRSRIHDESASEHVVIACNTLSSMVAPENDDGMVWDTLLEAPGLIGMVADGMMNRALKNTCRAALAELSTELLSPPFRADIAVVRPVIIACNHCVLTTGEDAEVFLNSLSSLGFCVQMRDERMSEAVKPPERMLPFLCNYTKTASNDAGISYAFKILAHVAGGTGEQTEETFKAGLLDVLPIGLQSENVDAVFYSLMAVRNLGCGTPQQKQLTCEATEVIHGCFRGFDRFGEEDEGAVEQLVQIIGNIVLHASCFPGEVDRRVEQYPLVQYCLLAISTKNSSIAQALTVLSMILRSASLGACVRGGRSNPFSTGNWERVNDPELLPVLRDVPSSMPQHFFAPVVCDVVWFYLAMGLSDRILKEDGAPLFSLETTDAKTWNRIIALRVITLLTGAATLKRVPSARVWLGTSLWAFLWSFYFV